MTQSDFNDFLDRSSIEKIKEHAKWLNGMYLTSRQEIDNLKDRLDLYRGVILNQVGLIKDTGLPRVR